MDDFVVNGKCSSVHEVSLSELMDMVRLTDGLPGKRVLIGIQPESFDWSEQPTPQVDAGIDLAAEKVTSLLRSWHDV